MAMNYQDAKAYFRQLEDKNKAASKAMKAFDIHRSALGLTPDHIKASPEWKATKAEFDRTSAESRNFSIWFNKTFKKEIAADRRVNGYNWMKN